MRPIDIIKKRHLDEIRYEHHLLNNLYLYDFICLVDDSRQKTPIFQFDISKNRTTKNSSAKEDFSYFLGHTEGWIVIGVGDVDFSTIVRVIAPDSNTFECTLRIYYQSGTYSEKKVSAELLSSKEIVFSVI
jgi:hypothetical protein